MSTSVLSLALQARWIMSAARLTWVRTESLRWCDLQYQGTLYIQHQEYLSLMRLPEYESSYVGQSIH